MIGSWSLAPFDPLSSERFWLPLWPVGAALFIATLTRCAGRRRLHLGVGLAGLALAAPTTLSFALAYAAQRPAAERETGLADPVWARSAPVRFLEESGVECTVVASDPRIHRVQITLPAV